MRSEAKKQLEKAKIIDAIMQEIIDESLRATSNMLDSDSTFSSNADRTDQDCADYPKIEVSDLTENESNPDVHFQPQFLLNDDTMSCKSHALPDTDNFRVSETEQPKKMLNTKSKIFTRSTDKDESCNASVCSEKVSPLTKLFSQRRQRKVFFPKNLVDTQSEKEPTNDHEETNEASRTPGEFGLFPNSEKDIRLSSKSLQNTQCNSSPLKETLKLRHSFANQSKVFKPTYVQDSGDFNREAAYNPNMQWQQMFTPEMAFNNILGMNCFQILNEKLNSFVGGKFQRPYYDVSLSLVTQI